MDSQISTIGNPPEPDQRSVGTSSCYSPDLNPIKMAFAKLKALIRKAATRTYDQFWKPVGHVCNLFKEEECYNFFKAAG